ncbi:Rieske 2Fe-2S domain-containing protein [Pseudanabaena sp. 'Roaring Creek']|uniref:Rieske 2Fe-2S domain-containing protein n=1 Tax=Pseudanabaena sp. 'Roaring Creek' TaxID=1681830 RepID=UPI0006D787F3|nr:Rieske 2Fe-2S domain-containing protein [Pseudanabaena sp. 'Roaring Creek']
MQKITELNEPPIVNAFYLVPCILIGDRKFEGFKKGEYCPVLLPWHNDADIGLKEGHYHYDFRFINPLIKIRNNSVLNEITRKPHSDIPFDITIHWKKKKCFDPDARYSRIQKLIDLDSTKRLVMKDNICPHRGTLLHSIPIHDGCVTCPTHGLTWNCKSGELVV